MKLADWQDSFIRGSRSLTEDAVGGAVTTSSNIAFIPSDVPAVHRELTRLSKKKHQWGIEILEQGCDYTVCFENYSSITVPSTLWENFKMTVFGTSALPESSFVVDLASYLAEAVSEEVERSLQLLKNSTVQFLNSDIVTSQRHKVVSLKGLAGSQTTSSTEGRSVITSINVEQQLSNFLQLIQTTYGNDVGSIQLVATAIQQRSPLTEIPLFEQYDNLISVVLSNESSIYRSVIGLDFTVQESLQFVGGAVPRMVASNPSFKVDGNVVYPTSPKGFPYNITDYLKGV